MQPLAHTLSKDKSCVCGGGFGERAQKGQCVTHKHPNNLGVGDVLSEEGWKVRTIVVELGSKPRSGAVETALLSVR